MGREHTSNRTSSISVIVVGRENRAWTELNVVGYGSGARALERSSDREQLEFAHAKSRRQTATPFEISTCRLHLPSEYRQQRYIRYSRRK